MTNVEYLNTLNPQQRQAVTAGNGPILVLAGPGSGKTRVLTHRIAYLIGAQNVRPYSILAVTFTNKAAREMEARVENLLGQGHRGMMLGTFHSVCARILRRKAEFIGVTSDFSIFDEDDQLALVKRAMREMNIDDKINRPSSVLSAISRAKNDMLAPADIKIENYKDKVVQKVYERYQQLLLTCNALDFDDLLLKTAYILNHYPVVREEYARKFEHILVDEFQDTNLPQYSLLQQLASVHNNIFVVGDEDQSIYRWRGADYHNVLRFEKDYPGYQKILLEQNYRSTQVILDAARSVIDKNRNRTVKKLRTDRGEGERLTLYEAPDDREEANYVVQTISEQVNSKRNTYADFAVMYRTNSQSRVLEEAFLHAGLPYRLVGAQRFYGRREVKDCIAYLRLIHNPADENSLDRIINVPGRGIGDKTVEQLHAVATEKGIAASAVLMDLAEGDKSIHWTAFSGAAARKLADFGSWLRKWLGTKETESLPVLFKQVFEDINYRQYIDDESEEDEDRWGNVEELLSLAHEYETTGLTPFLENIALVADQDTLPERPDAPTLLTLHASKGLEFPVVFITGLDEKILPHSRSLDDEEQMAEERRLFYVGITRAKDRLYLVRAERRAMYGSYDYSEPSRFLVDIPTKLVNASFKKKESYTSRASRWDSGEDRNTPTTTGVASNYMWKTGVQPVKVAPQKELRYGIGMHVNHPSWGEGLVLESKFIDQDEIVVVNFETVGLKRLDAALAGLTILNAKPR
jgi:DNA helicase-2/ATP-dependent DNA helicase PcrA